MFQRHIYFLPLFLILLSCSEGTPERYKLQMQGNTMGTRYHVTVIAKRSDLNKDTLQQSIDNELNKINQKMSTYIHDSEISQFNRFNKLTWFPISLQFANVVNASQEISRLTKGQFDITTGSLVNLWGFGPEHQLEIPTKPQITTELQKTGYQLLDIRLDPPALRKANPDLKIDLSAIAKGYAVDKIAEILLKQGYEDHLVEIGGEVIAHGVNLNNKPWRIAIENPSISQRSYNHTLNLTNQSVATSGDYRNYFEKSGQRYSHTINPNTGKPITHKLASVTVIGKSAMQVDAWATALMVMGEIDSKPFIEANNLTVFMIIKNGTNSFTTWNNLKGSNNN